MADSSDFCGHCFTEASQQCAACKNIKYCSRDCQKKDWSVIRPARVRKLLTSSRRKHKHLCKTFADFETPPGPNYRRIIVLPQESDKPRFAWLETYSSPTDEPTKDALEGGGIGHSRWDISALGVPETDHALGYELSEFKDVFGPGSACFPVYNLCPAHAGVDCGKSIHALFHTSQPRKERQLNGCLVNLDPSKAAYLRGRNGKGSVAFFTVTNVNKSKFIRDASCADLDPAVNALFDYYKTGAWDSPYGLIAEDWDEVFTGDAMSIWDFIRDRDGKREKYFEAVLNNPDKTIEDFKRKGIWMSDS